MNKRSGLAFFFLASTLTAQAAVGQDEIPQSNAIVDQEQASLYPVAFSNVNGLNSVLFLTTISQQGNYLVCPGLAAPPEQCVNLQTQSGVSAHTMQEVGIPDGTASDLLIQSADAATQGITSLLVQSTAGGVDFSPSVTVLISPAQPPGGQPPTGGQP